MKNPPLKDGDWTSLNERLDRIEKEFSKYVKPEVKKSQPEISSKTIGTSLNLDTTISSPIASPTSSQITNPPKTPSYTNTENKLIDSNYSSVTLSPDSMISFTLASQLSPSSYILELKAYNILNAYKRLFIADWVVLHDNSSPNQTVTITKMNIINDISLAGPIANGRDQASAFSGIVWIYFYAIYDSNKKEMASLSSLSSTNPTLPDGYDFYVKLGCGRVELSGAIGDISQVGNIHFWSVSAFTNTGPVSPDTYEYVSLIGAIPVTATLIFGRFGLSTNPGATRGMSVASDTYPRNAIDATLTYGTINANYPIISCIPYAIPIIEPLRMAWRASTTASIYAVYIDGFLEHQTAKPLFISKYDKFKQSESRTVT